MLNSILDALYPKDTQLFNLMPFNQVIPQATNKQQSMHFKCPKTLEKQSLMMQPVLQSSVSYLPKYLGINTQQSYLC